MAIKVVFGPDGPMYAECSTPEEALAILHNGGGVNGLSKNVATPPQTEPQIRHANEAAEDQIAINVFGGINDNAKKFLLGLADFPQGVKGDLFAAHTGIAAEKWGGTIGGISKIAKRNGVRIQRFVLSEMKIEGSRRYRLLKPGPWLVKYATKFRDKQEAV